MSDFYSNYHQEVEINVKQKTENTVVQ